MTFGSVASPLGLLVISNVFMTFAWYGHLKNHGTSPLWMAVLVSWGIAFFEYCFQVPANRMGSVSMTLGQLKISQEIITMALFCVFSVTYMKVPLTRNLLYASLCLVGAAYFIFQDAKP
ncbi:MAG: DMT family protein [Bdellovibrionales bacterium]|nr:DMT family protein [Bdellovibrionales bacterium]